MVISVHPIGRFFSKLEDHHHHHHESKAALSAAIQGFLSEISICLNDLGFDSNKPTSEILSFPWINRCFQLLRVQHRAFAKLLVEIDYPVRKHEASSGDGFFKYTLRLLELLNSISSCIADLSQARLRLSHALSLVEPSPSSAIDRLKPIGTTSFTNGSIKGEIGEISVEVMNSEKESMVHRALTIMKQIGSWVCGLVISGLSGEAEVFMEMRRSSGKLGFSALDRLDFTVHKAICESGVRLKEVKEVNDAVELLVASMADGKSSGRAAEDLQKRLEVLEKETDDLKKEVDSLFSDVLEERTKQIDCLRQTHKQ